MVESCSARLLWLRLSSLWEEHCCFAAQVIVSDEIIVRQFQRLKLVFNSELGKFFYLWPVLPACSLQFPSSDRC